MADNTNPENLHEVGKDAKKQTDKWVNPGTPTAPLVQEKDLPEAEVSKDASAKLRDNLTSHI